MFSIGISQIDITPQSGIFLTGYIAREGPSLGIHDRLYAITLALSSEDTSGNHETCVLLNLDLLALDEPTVAEVRQRIQAASDIPADHILISCTHTHSGPATIFLQDCGEVDPQYLEHLKHKLVESVQQAISQKQPALIAAGKGEWAEGIIDRRKPGREVDGEIGVISLHHENGKLAALLINFACHPVVLGAQNRLISGDYPGALRRLLQQHLDAPVLFFTGAAGNIDPARCGGFQEVEDFAGSLASKVLQILDAAEPIPVSTLAVSTQKLSLAVNPPPSSEQLEQLIGEHQQKHQQAVADRQVTQSRIERAMAGWAQNILDQSRQGKLIQSLPLEVQLMRIGNAYLVGISGEVFSSLGKAIKQAAPDNLVFISGFTNGDIGYIAPRQAYTEGGYEIVEAYRYYGFPGALRAGSGDELVAVAQQLLQQSLGNERSTFNE